MVSSRVVAVDVGASSGRVIEVELDGLRLKELHRFTTPWSQDGGFERWDFRGLVDSIRAGMGRATEPLSFAVDTWGVDFGLLDDEGNLIAGPIRYRDRSHERGFEELRRVSRFDWTGIQPWPFNTAAQLLARKLRGDDELRRATKLMFMPDLLAREIAGRDEVFAERTIASTSELLAVDGEWNNDAMRAAGITNDLLPTIVDAGHRIGEFVAVGAHDTASAVAAIPLGRNSVYISSGTWSLVGIESKMPFVGDRALLAGFSNERGLDGTFRFLKNVMGLWLLQGCQGERSNEECIALALKAKRFSARFDTNHSSLLNPPNMAEAIRRLADGDISGESTLYRCIFENLASAYAKSIVDIREISSKEIDSICIVGGGAQNELLNQMTADATGLTVLAGPVEATALGNALSQFETSGLTGSARVEGRSLVAKCYPQSVYEPKEHEQWREWLGV